MTTDTVRALPAIPQPPVDLTKDSQFSELIYDLAFGLAAERVIEVPSYRAASILGELLEAYSVELGTDYEAPDAPRAMGSVEGILSGLVAQAELGYGTHALEEGTRDEAKFKRMIEAERDRLDVRTAPTA